MNELAERITKIDHQILLFIQEHMRFDFLTPVMEYSSLLVNAGILWIVLGLILLIFKRTRVMGMVMLSSLTLGFMVNNIFIKNIVARERPFNTFSDLIPLVKASGYSFASGHTTASFASACVLVRFLNRPLAVITIAFAVIVAFSRLYLGVHYMTDVLCGFLIGLGSALLVYYIYSKKIDLKSHRIGC
ncbi:MAG: phosphatase PAP2 family protein [Lachnospiraceae bacterium]|nr:phosphatase PAP2 family protein [Lachnospiraceae bacterium]